MPLIKSSSRAAVSQNIRQLRSESYKPKQAVAIALDVQRRAKKADGGAVATARETIDRINRARAAEQESPDLTLMEKDRIRATQDAAASGDYDARGSYRPLPFRKAHGGPVRQRMQAGGVPFYVRSAAHGLERSGMIHSPTSGRSDRLPIGVKANSFVIPADVVSGIGQGNSMAGGAALSKLFTTAPGGAAMPHPSGMRMPTGGMMRGRRGFADGGDVAMDAAPVDIQASGGEFIVSPEKVAEIGGGDMDHGHSILNAMVKHIRKKTIKTLRKLPGPKKS